mmetsp:Transcript_18879/g.38752  ORF Transcript_18879/g.38752 Transcript_18879/m.38752 type:complete len:103 (-) Transcript_18879:93-401(-)
MLIRCRGRRGRGAGGNTTMTIGEITHIVADVVLAFGLVQSKQQLLSISHKQQQQQQQRSSHRFDNGCRYLIDPLTTSRRTPARRIRPRRRIIQNRSFIFLSC